jgi:hypothetical protein
MIAPISTPALYLILAEAEMFLFLLGIAGLFFGLLLPLGEAYFERDWPRSTFKSSLCLIALGLLCLSCL